MKTKLKLMNESCLRVRPKHYKAGQTVWQVWHVEMQIGRKWYPLAESEEKDIANYTTREAAEAALELHREALMAVNDK